MFHWLKFFCAALVLSASTVGIYGCAPKKEPRITVSAAQKKLEEKCREDYNLNIITRIVDNTFWVYLSTTEPIVDFEAQKESTEKKTDAKQAPPLVLQDIDIKFANNSFNVAYDVIDRKKADDENFGYTSTYTDSYVKDQNNLFTAFSESFFDAEADKEFELPEFVVIVITDIKKGIETKGTFYLQDFKRLMVGDLPYEEYVKRYIVDTKGGQSFIGDETGEHLDWKAVTMTDFLCKQMINRVRFKFQHSDFKPTANYDNDVMGIVADTLRYYTFKDFKEVRLFNLRKNQKYIYDPDQLANFGDEKIPDMPSKGKLIRIRFDGGKAEIEGMTDAAEEPTPASKKSQ